MRRVDIDLAQVESLASLGCTDAEIAHVLKISERTLRRRARKALDNGRALFRVRLRNWQLRACEQGNAAVLIWLGKVYLGQKEVRETTQDGETLRIVERVVGDSDTDATSI